MKRLLLIILFSTIIKTAGFSQLNEHVNGKINMQEADNLINIEAVIENEELIFKENLFYTLLAVKKKKSGSYDSNRQSGEFSIKPEEKKVVSKLRLSLNKDEVLKIYLFVKHNDILVSKDSMIIFPTSQKKFEKEVVNSNEFELKGIVIESVITKIGKDFYDYFYQDYLASGSQYTFIIYIKEKPYFGYSSIISLEVDDRKIFEFFSKPDEDYLRSGVKSSLQALNQYAKRRKILFKNRRI
jgi:curli assembly protein CsgE